MQLLSIRIERSLNILSLPASASILDLRRDDPFELLFLDYSDDATPPKLERRVYLALCGETLPNTNGLISETPARTAAIMLP